MDKYIISEYVDLNAMSIFEITDNFSVYLKEMDGSKLSKENRDLIIKLCKEYPILRILCHAMYSAGYSSF